MQRADHKISSSVPKQQHQLLLKQIRLLQIDRATMYEQIECAKKEMGADREIAKKLLIAELESGIAAKTAELASLRPELESLPSPREVSAMGHDSFAARCLRKKADVIPQTAASQAPMDISDDTVPGTDKHLRRSETHSAHAQKGWKDPGLRPLSDMLECLHLAAHHSVLEDSGYRAVIDIADADIGDLIDLGLGVTDAQRIFDACVKHCMSGTQQAFTGVRDETVPVSRAAVRRQVKCAGGDHFGIRAAQNDEGNPEQCSRGGPKGHATENVSDGVPLPHQIEDQGLMDALIRLDLVEYREMLPAEGFVFVADIADLSSWDGLPRGMPDTDRERLFDHAVIAGLVAGAVAPAAELS